MIGLIIGLIRFGVEFAFILPACGTGKITAKHKRTGIDTLESIHWNLTIGIYPLESIHWNLSIGI